MLDDTRTGLNGAVRQLFARIAPSAVEPRRPRRPVIWATDAARPARATASPPPTPARRADAHAAYRAVEGSEQAALDAALAVVEAEVARLRGTVLAYGEALKAIEVYGRDPSVARAPPPRRCAGRRSGCSAAAAGAASRARRRRMADVAVTAGGRPPAHAR